MEPVAINLSDQSWSELERHLSPEERANLSCYISRLIEKDLLERRRAALEEVVRRELLAAGATRVVALDIDDFGRDPRGYARYVARTGEPLTIHVDGKPALLVQDVRRIVRSAWDWASRGR